MPNTIEFAGLKSEIKKASDGTYEFIMSEETVDRDGEIIEVDGWDTVAFKDNSILLFGHRHDLPGIGVVGKVVKGLSPRGKKALIAKGVRFATQGIYELADIVHGLVDDEVIKATSVGFQALEREYINDENRKKEDKGVRVRTKKAALYELSIVNVGAHPSALRTKSAADKAALEYEGKDIENIQTGLLADLFEQKSEPGQVESEKSMKDLIDTVLKKIDELCVKVEKYTAEKREPKPKRLYDELLAGDPNEGRTNPADKEDDLASILPKARPIDFFKG